MEAQTAALTKTIPNSGFCLMPNLHFFQRILGNIGQLFGFELPEGSVQPTLGVSFGLPQQSGAYGGYAQNPVNTGPAVNPYYNSPNGLPVGAVDVNPLVSFQTTTNDDGELVAKPLINLHVTPNGCGIFGCDYDEQFHSNRKHQDQNGFLDYSFPKPKYQQQYPQQQYQHPQQQYHHQQQQYPQQQYHNYDGPPTTPESEPFFPSAVIVKHEHNHYHHHQPQHHQQQHRPQPQHGGGVSFGYNDVYGRNGEGDKENNEVKKRNVVVGSSHPVPIEDARRGDQKPESESAFRFPEGRSLNKRSADGDLHHDHGHGHHHDHGHGHVKAEAPDHSQLVHIAAL